MSKPTHWIVTVNGIEHTFTERARARGFAMIRRAHGDVVTIEAKGY